MLRVLVSWIGTTDLRAPEESAEVGRGPVAQALEELRFDEACLLTNHGPTTVEPYRSWLQARVPNVPLHVVQETLSSPTDFGEIYAAAVRACEGAVDDDVETSLAFHLSPGTPAMAAIWIILAKTRFPAELIESSRQHGVRTASVPFDISADFLPDLLRQPDRELERLSAGLPPEAPEFDEILHRSAAMKRIILRARRVAPRSVPVVIEGETGTGKELLARAIHRASPRRDRLFVAVNCGALSPELVESELFGHEKGAFTGASTRRDGHFVAADGGTLFLDEIGELPLSAQVKLLRALQEGEVLPVGSSRPRTVNVRPIAATNRSLPSEVEAGRFREDLFYRLAVAVLRLPPLRERASDLALLIDRLLERVNREGERQPGHVHKKLSAGAKNLLLSHSWPGNVRELQNTLRRLALWSPGDLLTRDDVREALLPAKASNGKDAILGRSLGQGLDVREVLAEVARHYLARALEQAGGNKTEAARLVGLPSYQTFSNWMHRFRLEP
ncbi:MAG: sigma-54 dependent transcriptional regulator [Acidobacteria bacterium]|nr:sigma-54 dependent transcriptional regulator [Acidobacteriota bacterium]